LKISKEEDFKKNFLDMRNSQEVRNHFCELVCMITNATKMRKPIPLKKISNNDFSKNFFESKLRAKDYSTSLKILTPNDPQEMTIIVNEFAYNISDNHYNINQALYWLSWILEWEKTNINKYGKYECNAREIVGIENKCKKDYCDKKVDKNHNYCIDHKCNNCNNEKNNIFFCKECGCNIKSCRNIKKLENTYCDEHTCNHKNCFNKIVEKTYFRNGKINNCNNHAEIVEETNFCQDHTCKLNNCNNNAEFDDNGYCQNHQNQLIKDENSNVCQNWKKGCTYDKYKKNYCRKCFTQYNKKLKESLKSLDI